MQTTRSILAKLAVSIVQAGWLSAPAGAADHMNLDEGLPVTIEDAFPVPYRQREIQALGHYDNVRDDPKGHNLFTLEPRFEAGLFRNFQGGSASPIASATPASATAGM